MMKWSDLDDKLRRISDRIDYLAVDDDGMVTVYIGPVDKHEVIPEWTGLAFDSSEVIQRILENKRRTNDKDIFRRQD